MANRGFLPEDPAGSSAGEDGEPPEMTPSANTFPRANIAGTGHYDHGIDHISSEPYVHGGGGVVSYGREHPQSRKPFGGGRMRRPPADRNSDEGSPIEHGIGESYETGEGMPQRNFGKKEGREPFGGGRMGGRRAEKRGDEDGPIEHSLGEHRMEEDRGGKAVSQAGGRGRRR